MIMTCHGGSLVVTNVSSTLMGDGDNGGGHVWGQGIYAESLYLPLHFASSFSEPKTA